MKVVIDTNVFISGVFWSGPPERILHAWQSEYFKMVITPEILDEYRRTASNLTHQYPTIDLNPIFEFVLIHADLYASVALPEQICRDPDDDIFIAAALAADARYLITGDNDLLVLNQLGKVKIMKPKVFCDLILDQPKQLN